jgi:ubiquinone/menaquinone biosynthesis C-methylase UbiE
MSDFDRRASQWDNPANIERALATFKAMNRYFRVSKEFDCLEYGSGTGLLSFHFQPLVRSITLVDTSEGMLDVARGKIEHRRIDNMKTVKSDLVSLKGYDESFDLIYTLMALHHAEDTAGIVSVFYGLLKKRGILCIADLVEEDGSFHEHHADFNGHNGFDIGRLSHVLCEAGFTKPETDIYYSIEREMQNGSVKSFPLFLLVCRKAILNIN